MSTHPNPTATEPKREQKTYALAAELDVDAALLDDFVSNHPRPTPAIVLGWATAQGGDVAPDRVAAEVEEWLDSRLEKRTNRQPITAEELPTDGRLGPNAGGWR